MNFRKDATPQQTAMGSTPAAFTVTRLHGIGTEDETDYALVHQDSFIELLWVIKGRGTFAIDLERIPFEDNAFFCAMPGQMHHLQDACLEDAYLIQLPPAYLDKIEQEIDLISHTGLFKIMSRYPGTQISADIAAEMVCVAVNIIKEFNNPYMFREEMMRRYLKIFLVYLKRQFSDALVPKVMTRNMELVKDFQDLLEKHFRDLKKVSDYAHRLSVTPNYLNERIKKLTGYSASYHIKQRIVLEAKRMATYSTVFMKEAAYDLGFNDFSHFSKFFKSTTGINFSDFKKERIVMAEQK